MNPITITDVKTILTAPADIWLVVTKIETSEPGLYGLGCATFTQRHHAVAAALDKHLRPFLLGKDVQRIEDLFQTMNEALAAKFTCADFLDDWTLARCPHGTSARP